MSFTLQRMGLGLMSVVVVLAASIREQPVAAQDRPAAELVCVGHGGESLGVEEWTRAQIDAWEAEWGRPMLRVNRETGTCEDPAGLPVWWDGTQDFRYECFRDAAGDWLGPSWVLNIYHDPANRPPDPATGNCPSPRGQWPQSPETERAAAFEVYFSQLIAGGDFATLYQWMHPDSQAHISEAAAAGWFAANVDPTRPTAEVIDKVRFVDWTWPVTGSIYPGTAEVTVHYRTADGALHNDVTHLVRDQGVWRWLFGRDASFVNEVEATYGE